MHRHCAWSMARGQGSRASLRCGAWGDVARRPRGVWGCCTAPTRSQGMCIALEPSQVRAGTDLRAALMHAVFKVLQEAQRLCTPRAPSLEHGQVCPCIFFTPRDHGR